jgi:hypothetical protein
MNWYKGYGLWWVRVLGGWGIAIKNTDKASLFFSERKGLAWGVRWGKWYVRFLGPNTIGGD